MRKIIYLSKVFRYYSILGVKYFIYLFVIKRYCFLKSLSRINFFYYLTYLVVIIFYNIFCISSIANISTCARNLLIINIISLYLTYYLSLVNNILSLFLHIYRSIYITTKIIFVTLDLIYSIIKIVKISKLKLF